MKTVQVSRGDLLVKLQENRKKHEADYVSAKKIWLKKAKKAYAKAAKRATDGDFEMYPLSDLPEPQNFLKSYDQAIAMVQMELRAEIELDQSEFAKYILDEWEWQRQFAASTSHYNAR